MTNKIKINSLRIIDYKPKELLAVIEISVQKEDKKEKITKEYYLKRPEELLNSILVDIKSRNKIIIDDPTLDPIERLNIYSPILIEDEEKTEEKIYNFLRMSCEKAAHLKNSKEAKVHIKLLDYFKTASLQL